MLAILGWILIGLIGVFFLLVMIGLIGRKMGMSVMQPLTSNPAPELEGHIFYQGQPLAHVEVIRRYTEYGETPWKEQRTRTDDQGYFFLEDVTLKDTVSALAEYSANQEIFINYQNTEEYIFGSSSRYPDKNISFGGGKPINFICDLGSEKKTFRTQDKYKVLIGSRCRWTIQKSDGSTIDY